MPEQRYAVFEHSGHITSIKQTYNAIWRDWLPKSGHQPSMGPSLEVMDEARAQAGIRFPADDEA